MVEPYIQFTTQYTNKKIYSNFFSNILFLFTEKIKLEYKYR